MKTIRWLLVLLALGVVVPLAGQARCRMLANGWHACEGVYGCTDSSTCGYPCICAIRSGSTGKCVVVD